MGHIRVRGLSSLFAAVVLLMGVAVAVLIPVPALAAEDPDAFSFRSMHADYELGRGEDGVSTLRVTETLVAEFPEIDQNHGIRREIPERYLDLPTRPRIESVTDANGQARQWDDESDDGFLVVTIADDDFVHGEQTYVITYTMRNVTRHFADTGVDEFYWNINGTGWRQPFGEVSMTLRTEGTLASALTGKSACYLGAYGSNERCDISAESGVITAGGRDLAPGANMTVAVAFDAGTFRLPEGAYFGTPAGYVQAGAVGVAAVAVAGAAVVRRRRLRDEPGYPTVIPQYAPPADYDAWESAVLLGTHTGPTAELLEQAVRGSLRLVETAGPKGKSVMRAELVDPSRAGDRDGAQMLTALFGNGARVGAEFTFGKHDAGFEKAVSAAQAEIVAAQKNGGVRKVVPFRVRAWPLALAAVGALVAIVLVFVIDGTSRTKGLAFGALAAAIVLMVVAIVLIAKTPFSRHGAEVRDHLAGLKQFMRWAEADRVRMLQSPDGAERVDVSVDDPRQMVRLYEPLLPYAVVFGLEKHWSDVLGRYYASSQVEPNWFVGPGPFNSALLASALSTTSTAMTTSSTSGGSSGGGFSGGGGGGGGGGGV